MSKILSLHAVPGPALRRKAASVTSNVGGYVATALWFTGCMTGVLAVCALLALTRLL
jgi:hypothetical protein